MKIVNKYSHLNGEEYLLVHKPDLYDEIKNVITSLDANEFRNKESKEKGKKGNLLYSPTELNKEFERLFNSHGWVSVRRDFYVSADFEQVRILEGMDYEDQKEYIAQNNLSLYHSYNQTDFVKEHVAVEVQLGKYFAVTYDLFVKHLSFYNVGLIDVGVEIVPSKELQNLMSSGVPFYEKEVHNVLRHGRTTPPVPLIIIGVSP